MKLLAFDTSSTACSVGLLCEGKITLKHEVAPMQQAKMILPLIHALLTPAHISIQDLDAIAFGQGPGSFTGVRIATSVAQGLGYAANLPLIPVSSLASVAQLAYEIHGWKNVLVAMDARIHEVYWGAYEVQQNGLMTLIDKEMVCVPEKVPVVKEGNWYSAGDGWEVYKEKLRFSSLACDSSLMPHASGILAIAQADFLQKKTIQPCEALPVYLRDEVAIKS